MDQPIQKLLEEICRIFPLKSFWKHVIIIWTHYNGTPSVKRKFVEKAETGFTKEFID